MYVRNSSFMCVSQREVNYRVLQSQLAAQIFEQFLDLGGREREELNILLKVKDTVNVSISA